MCVHVFLHSENLCASCTDVHVVEEAGKGAVPGNTCRDLLTAFSELIIIKDRVWRLSWEMRGRVGEVFQTNTAL